jgi:hypothetical protein
MNHTEDRKARGKKECLFLSTCNKTGRFNLETYIEEKFVFYKVLAELKR